VLFNNTSTLKLDFKIDFNVQLNTFLYFPGDKIGEVILAATYEPVSQPLQDTVCMCRPIKIRRNIRAVQSKLTAACV
jgi:hypothetical protein